LRYQGGSAESESKKEKRGKFEKGVHATLLKVVSWNRIQGDEGRTLARSEKEITERWGQKV